VLVAATAGWAQPGAGGTLKPLVTVSFSGYDEIVADVNFLGQLGGQPALGQMLEGLLKQRTGGQGLAGIDKSKPWGAVVQTDGAMGFPFYIFVPVTDLQAALGILPGVETEDAGDGVLELSTPGEPAFVKESNGWAFVSNQKEVLADVPADPTQQLGQLTSDYDVAIEAHVQNVPQPFRQMFTAQLRMGAQMGMQRMPGEDADQFAIRSGMTRQMLDQFAKLVEELDTFLVGLNIDRDGGSVYLDVELTAVPGTQTAQDLAAMSIGGTNFAGFDLPGAAATLNIATKLSDSDVAQATAQITQVRDVATQELKNQGLSQEELDLATKLLNDMLDVAKATLEKRLADGGAVVMLKSDAVTVAAGGAIVEGDKLEGVVKRLAGEIQKDDPDAADQIQLDAETYQNVRFHKLGVPVPEEDAKRFFGETLEIVLGVNDQSAYVAFGRDAAGLLKQVIDKSQAEPNKEVPPMKLSIAATPIAEFVAAAAAQDDPAAAQMAGMMAQVLSKHAGKDHVTIVSEPVENGSRLRIEVEQGILAVIPAIAAQAAMGGGRARPGGFGGGESPF
jgi:hypothetical protein